MNAHSGYCRRHLVLYQLPCCVCNAEKMNKKKRKKPKYNQSMYIVRNTRKQVANNNVAHLLGRNFHSYFRCGEFYSNLHGLLICVLYAPQMINKLCTLVFSFKR